MEPGQGKGNAEFEPIIVRRSPFFLALQISLLLFLTGLFVIGTISMYLLFFSGNNDALDILEVFFSPILIIAILTVTAFNIGAIILGTLKWSNEYYEITEAEIIHVKGILSEKRESYPLERIETIDVKQDFLGRILQYGTITLLNPILPVENREMHLVAIPHPQKYVETIKSLKGRGEEEIKEKDKEHVIIRND